MTSSGMKRGLAATAVSALAVTGLPFLTAPAHADSLADQAPAADAVVLHTPEDAGFASIKDDGVNSTVRLLANAGEDVVQVRFEYLDVTSGTWKTIATVARSNGAFSTEWTPPTSTYNLPTQIRATGLGSVATEIGSDTNVATVSSNADSVNISNAPGSSVGVYENPDGAAMGAVSGTTSDTATNPGISISSPSGTGATTSEDVAGPVSTGATTRSFSGPVDFSGYTWDTNAADGTVNEALVYVEADGSDAEAVTLYEQTITTVSAVADPATVQGTSSTTAVVTVLDQNGKPVVGAHVYKEGGSSTATLTNSQGEATFSGLTGSTAGSTYAFFVDEDGDAAFDSGEEFRRTVTVTSYTPTATSLVGDSHDGAAFDFTEYTADNGEGEGDITVTVKDQNGAALKGQSLTGRWTVTPFDGSASTTSNATITDTDADGVYNVAFPAGTEGSYTLNVWIERDGNPGQSTGDLSMAPLTFKAGQAEINWDDNVVAQAQASSTASFGAAMQLDDGTGLVGRNVAITWTKNAAGNAVLAAQAAQPAGTTRTSNTTASAVTGSDGSFAVAVSDPASSPAVNEKGGTLDATGVATPGIGDSAAESDPLTVDFLADPAVSSTTTGTTEQALGGAAAPGRPVRVNITVKNAAGDTLTDLPVKVSTDHGFFTTPDATTLSELNPAPAAAEGANYGEWENLGSTYNTSTDDAGHAHAVVAVERDAGFDDDGKVTANVLFEVGGKTFTEPVEFDSSNPMNPGEVVIQLARQSQQTVTILPKAPTTERVAFDVKATDQFGNRTDVVIDLSDNTANATIENLAGEEVTSVTSRFTGDPVSAYGAGDAATSQVVSGLWDDAATLTWTDAQPATTGFQEEALVTGADGTKEGTKDVSDSSPAIAWYVINLDASSFRISTSPSDGPIRVGTAVRETLVAIDQMGEPIAGLGVDWFRSGPDTNQDGESKQGLATSQTGRSSYTFIGTKAGLADISAVVSGGDFSRTVTDSVRFKKAIAAGLDLGNQRDGDDVARVNAPSAARGATVSLYKVRADGTRKLVATKRANSEGNAGFVVNDRNGRRYTKFQAKVGGTMLTFADWTPKKRVR